MPSQETPGGSSALVTVIINTYTVAGSQQQSSIAEAGGTPRYPVM